MNTIRIDTNHLPNLWRIYLDGQDVSRFVQAIYLEARVDAIPRVHLVLVGNIELPEDIQCLVTASTSDNNESDEGLTEMTAFADQCRHFDKNGG